MRMCPLLFSRWTKLTLQVLHVDNICMFVPPAAQEQEKWLLSGWERSQYDDEPRESLGIIINIDRVVVVTGVSSGIGYAVTKALVAHQCHVFGRSVPWSTIGSVILHSHSSHVGVTLILLNAWVWQCSVRTEADAKRLQGEFGDFYTPLIFDVTDEKAVHKAAVEVRSRMKGHTLLGLVNNAGMHHP